MSYQEVIIGSARLFLGDCRDILPALSGIGAVVTDPPFGMIYQSSRRTDKHERIAGDGDKQLLMLATQIPAAHSRYVFCRWNDIGDVPAPKSCITWIKNNWTSGDLDHAHGRQTEQILFYPGPEHEWPDYRPSDVVDCRKVSSDRHPTEKPVDLMRLVVEWTRGTVLDPFMGSGTTGVACAKLGRKFVGIECEARYFDLACRRITEAQRHQDLFVHAPVAEDPAEQRLRDLFAEPSA